MGKKAFLLLLLTLFVLFSAFSYRDGHLHEKDIAGLFFDYYYSDDLLNSSKCLSNCLCPALYLTLDYCKRQDSKGQDAKETNQNEPDTKGLKSRNQLVEYGIYLQDDEMILICTPGSQSHEAYTHLGWDCDYTTEPFPFKSGTNLAFFCNENWKAWATRKKVLVEAVAKVFDFPSSDSNLAIRKIDIQKRIKPKQIRDKEFKKEDNIGLIDRLALSQTTKTESMAAVLYYTHVLGDIKGNANSTGNTRISLKSLCEELEKHLVNLFGRRELNKYSALCNALEISSSAEDILKSLMGAFPGLLEDCSFYKNTEIKNDVERLHGISITGY